MDDKKCGELILICQDIYDNAQIDVDLESHPDYVLVQMDTAQWIRFAEALAAFD